MGSGADFRTLQQLTKKDMHVFLINGPPGAGKDTFCEFLFYELIPHRWKVKNYSSVDTVKTAAALLGWDNKKDAKGRAFLSALKDLSTVYYNGPFYYMESRMEEFYTLYAEGVLLLHCREPEELAKFITKHPTVRTLLIRRDSKEEISNHADANVYAFTYDHEIHNTGTVEELKEKVKLFASDLREGKQLANVY